MPAEEELPLPQGVYEKHGSWHLVERNQWRKLCRVEEGRQRLYIRLHEVTGGIKGMTWHAILSYRSDGMKDLAAATQKHYANTALRLLHHFGHWRLDDLEPTHCKQFLKWHQERGTPTQGNREKAVMSSVYEYAMGNGWAASNPWRGVRRNKERPSRRYIEHETLVAALDRAPPQLRPLLAVAYLTGIRQTDLRLLKREQITPLGLIIDEHKTHKRNLHQVTPTIWEFLQSAMERTPNSEYVFTSAEGLPWSEWGLQSALRRFGAGFRFRDLRAKAQTDRPDKDILGHTGQMRERYTKRRKLSAVK
jgi:integrase